MSNPKSVLDMALDVVTNPWVLAGLGGAAGYYFFGRKDGKTIEGKTPYIAAGIGAATGLAAGKLIQHFRMQSQHQMIPGQMTPEQMAAHQQAYQQAKNEYYDMDSVDVDQVFQSTPAAAAAQAAQGVPIQADIEQPMGLGSLDGSTLGSSSLGSFDRDVGFDAFDMSVDEAAAGTDDLN